MDQLEILHMKGVHVSAAVVMLLLCLLSLNVFLIPAFSDVHVSPMLVILILTLCCMTMMHMLMGSEDDASRRRHAAERSPEAGTSIELASKVAFDDLMQVTSTEDVGGKEGKSQSLATHWRRPGRSRNRVFRSWSRQTSVVLAIAP